MQAPTSRIRGRNHVPLILLLPAVLIYGLVVVYPNVAGALWSFTDWNGLSQHRSFTGLQNVQRLIHDPAARSALVHSFMLLLFAPALQTLLGLVLALGLNRQLRLGHFLRTFLFFPVVLAPVVVAFLWQYLYSPTGSINAGLRAVGLGGLQQVWLGDPRFALWAILVVVLWQFSGLSMTIFLAGLQTIPEEVFDAARVDGAGRLKRLLTIEVPLLRPAFLISITIATIGSLKLFDQIFAMTGGGPADSTEVMATYQYKQAFTFGEFGYGSLVGLALSVIVVVVVAIQWFFFRTREARA